MIFEKQNYQQVCINNILTLLQDFDFKSQENLPECLKRFHTTHPQPIKTLSQSKNVDILMETGTGKTFTYLNLIFALHKTYRQNKFIIFVPRKAILESVKQNIELTKSYFFSEFGAYLKTYYYTDSKSQSAIINHYIKNTDELSVLVLTNSAVDKKDNLLNKQSEGLFNEKSIFENIIALKPICIIDEPHLLKGERFSAAFRQINTLYFRFGATFPKEPKESTLSNVAFVLDSISAFQNYLVKQIAVGSISGVENEIFLKDIRNKEATFVRRKSGELPQYKRVKIGESLEWQNFATLVRLEKGKAYFDNGATIQSQENYKLSNDEISLMLEKAIEAHFQKEQFLFSQNIKALSLFFIPSIADFRAIDSINSTSAHALEASGGGGNPPFIKLEFERLYRQKRTKILKELENQISKTTDENARESLEKYQKYLESDFDENGILRVHQGYFSGDAKISGNNSENQEAADIALILSDKQKLLSFNSPLRFIFSVWALQEGWDNPNIFTLTKLASSKDTSTHQQIGRGLRLCVNEAGKRITHNFMQGDDTSFYQINCLDVIVSGKEPLFIENLQKEINESSFSFNENTLSLEQLESLLDKDKANDIIYLLKRDKIIAYNEINENYNILVPLYEAIKESAEIKELLGDKFNDFLAHFVPNANKNKQVVDNNKPKELIKIKPHLAKDFKELWEAINKKAKIVYKNIQENALIDSIAKEFNALEIPKNHIIYTRKTFDAQNNIIITEDSTTLDTMSYQKAVQENIKSLLLDFAKGDKKEEKFKLPLHFVLRLYESLDKNNFYNNPSLAFNELNAIIKRQIHSELVQKIDYQFARNEFSPSYKNLIDSKGNVKQSIERHILGQVLERDTSPARNYLYEQIVRDSNIEKDISQENNESLEGAQIKVFAKLPKLSIPTPYKEYQPDFAYFLEDSQGKRIFFICESKGYNDKSEIPPDEAKKIEYAKVFFASLSKALKSENIRIEFKTRINKQELNEILREILQKD